MVKARLVWVSLIATLFRGRSWKVLKALQSFLEGLVFLVDFETDEEGEEKLVMLEQTPTDVAVENLAELILQAECALLHLHEALLLCHVGVRHTTGSSSSFRLVHHGLIAVIILRFVVIIRSWLLQIEGLIE